MPRPVTVVLADDEDRRLDEESEVAVLERRPVSIAHQEADQPLRDWAAAVPDGFQFAIKMTRNITFGGRIDAVGTFCERVRALGDRLGPVLIRFPDDRPRDDGVLQLLVGSLDPELRYAFDLR